MTSPIKTNPMAQARRMVIKIGSALMVTDAGAVRHEWLAALAEDLSNLRQDGAEILVVSSGAIAVGRRHLGLRTGPRNKVLRLDQSQAAAATGQIRLAHAWQEALARHDIPVAQILLTLDDTEDRRRYLNARNTLDSLLRLRVIPVINENDTVATDEIRYGDNDRLAARVAQMASADTCILLSDVDGLYSADPNIDATARHIAEVATLDAAVEAMAAPARAGDGSGGMVTKLAAARIAMQAGCRLAIASGKDLHPLRALSQGARATWFLPRSEPLTARKKWIAAGLSPSGVVTIDAGAAAALQRGSSLLPAGVTGLTGTFKRGDLVTVQGPGGATLGRGLIAYSAPDGRLIMGHQSSEIEHLLGYLGREEMIHRDNLVLDGGAPGPGAAGLDGGRDDGQS